MELPDWRTQARDSGTVSPDALPRRRSSACRQHPSCTIVTQTFMAERPPVVSSAMFFAVFTGLSAGAIVAPRD
jgi:hypothetical protein